MTTFKSRVKSEVDRVSALHKPFANVYEALGVLCEEIDEFKEEVWKKRSLRDKNAMISELVQVGAMVQKMSESFDLGRRVSELSDMPFDILVQMKMHDSPITDLKIVSAHQGYMLILKFFLDLQQKVFCSLNPDLDLMANVLLCDLVNLAIIVEEVGTQVLGEQL